MLCKIWNFNNFYLAHFKTLFICSFQLYVLRIYTWCEFSAIYIPSLLCFPLPSISLKLGIEKRHRADSFEGGFILLSVFSIIWFYILPSIIGSYSSQLCIKLKGHRIAELCDPKGKIFKELFEMIHFAQWSPKKVVVKDIMQTLESQK